MNEEVLVSQSLLFVPRHLLFPWGQAPRPCHQSGAGYLPNVGLRSVVARRYRDIAEALIADQGGPERMSEARLQLCRRFAASSVHGGTNGNPARHR
jgi:hypothetical protein